jgi:hypothetical protein
MPCIRQVCWGLILFAEHNPNVKIIDEKPQKDLFSPTHYK